MAIELDNELEALAHIAHLYYEEGATQSEIAAQLKVSRSTISRMLSEARSLGVVEIRINYPTPRQRELEQHFLDHFSLSAVYILRTKGILAAHWLQRVARLAANHLEERVRPDTILGVSWGTAVYETVSLLQRQSLPNARVVQFIGAIGRGDRAIDGPELARQLATTWNSVYHYLHTPLIVDNRSTRDTLLGARSVSETMELARRADIALVGIGSTQASVSSLVRAGYLSEEELHWVESAGAVGDVCGHHFDIAGRVLDIDLNHRIVGISPTELQAVPEVIGVASGILKAPAILGALRGKFIDVLVTDETAAREVLRLRDEAPSDPVASRKPEEKGKPA